MRGIRSRNFLYRWNSHFLLAFLFALLSTSTFAVTLSDAAVDAYNVRVGTQTFAGLYQFTTNTLLVETAQAISGMGSDIIKMYLGSNYPFQYRQNLPGNVTNLMTLARDLPSCRQVLDMPFRHFICWAYPFSNPDAPFQDGNYTSTEAANDYREMYDLTRYLLTNYNNSGKTFFLGHWEGDGYLNVNNWSTNPSPAVIQGMINWENQRQKAVDDAKTATGYTNVNVYYYAEANRVRDAMLNGATNNERVINYVAPYVTNLDYLSYSSYDAMNLATSDLYATLDYMEAHLPTNKVSTIPGERIWIGEYGWGGSQSTAQQEPTTRAYIQRLLNYGRQALAQILFWEIYDNETNKLFCLIDSNNVKTASYYLHQRFINNARLFTAQFKETNGRLPSDSEFVSLVSPMLNQPLPAPINLTVANRSATTLSSSSARVSGTLAQGVYGDDCAAVRVFYGRQDGGSVRSAWEASQFLTVNTNFNSLTFNANLSGLAANTNYFFRFYATNASGEVWAPASSEFSTATVNPPDYGSRMKIFFSGYSRGETLTNFPVLVCLSTNLAGFSYRGFASITGGDLRFTDAGGIVAIPHEIDEWNTNGTSYVWVSIPQLSGPSDFVWAYWGNPLAANPPGTSTNGAVWLPNYSIVYHLKESTFPYADSTAQHPAVIGVNPASNFGQIGHGCLFNGTSQFLDAGVVNLGSAFTLSAWVNVSPASTTNIQTIWANQPGGYGKPGFAMFVNAFNTSNRDFRFASGDGVNGQEVGSGVDSVSFGQWHLLTAAVDQGASTVQFYIDANKIGSGAVVADFPVDQDLNLGRFTNANFYFTGIMDEARIQNGVCSSNWVWASYTTVAANTELAAYATVTQQSPMLSLTSAASAITATWPASGVGFGLFSTTNLAPPVVWTAITNQPALAGGQWQVLLPPDNAGARFYRLEFR